MKTYYALVILILSLSYSHSEDLHPQTGEPSILYANMDDVKRYSYTICYGGAASFFKSHYPTLSVPNKDKEDYTEIRWSDNAPFPPIEGTLLQIGRISDKQIIRVDYHGGRGFTTAFAYLIKDDLYRPFYVTSASDDISTRLIKRHGTTMLEVKTAQRGTGGYVDLEFFDFKDGTPQLVKHETKTGRFRQLDEK